MMLMTSSCFIAVANRHFVSALARTWLIGLPWNLFRCYYMGFHAHTYTTTANHTCLACRRRFVNGRVGLQEVTTGILYRLPPRISISPETTDKQSVSCSVLRCCLYSLASVVLKQHHCVTDRHVNDCYYSAYSKRCNSSRWHVCLSVCLLHCRDITGRLTMQTCLGSPEDPII